MEARIETDGCVAVAGYSGLTAARRLAQAGVDVVVLEARDRVRGRVWTRRRGRGIALDMGGTFAGPHQDRIRALAGELKVETHTRRLEAAGRRTRNRPPNGSGACSLAPVPLSKHREVMPGTREAGPEVRPTRSASGGKASLPRAVPGQTRRRPFLLAPAGRAAHLGVHFGRERVNGTGQLRI